MGVKELKEISDESEEISSKVREYSVYIHEHRENVKSVCRSVFNQVRDMFGDSIAYDLRTRADRHDDSKRCDAEFEGYRRYFYRTESEQKSDEASAGFDRAWNHHQKTNDHHWEYWCLIDDHGGTTAIEIPLCAVLEMLCDWAAMSIRFNDSPSNFFFNQRAGRCVLLHRKSEELVKQLLPMFDEAVDAIRKVR